MWFYPLQEARVISTKHQELLTAWEALKDNVSMLLSRVRNQNSTENITPQKYYTHIISICVDCRYTNFTYKIYYMFVPVAISSQTTNWPVRKPEAVTGAVSRFHIMVWLVHMLCISLVICSNLGYNCIVVCVYTYVCFSSTHISCVYCNSV